MAIVHRKPREFFLDPANNNQNLGPGYYQFCDNLLYKKGVCFSMGKPSPKDESKNQSPKKDEPNLGPGSYPVSDTFAEAHKTVLNDEKNKVFVVQNQLPSHMFRSVTNRYHNSDVDGQFSYTPGPGSYNTAKILKNRGSNKSASDLRKNILSQVLKNPRYRPVRSIPCNSPFGAQFYDSTQVQKAEELQPCHPHHQHYNNIHSSSPGSVYKSNTSQTKKRCFFKKAVRQNDSLKPGTSFGKSRQKRIPEESFSKATVPVGTYFVTSEFDVMCTLASLSKKRENSRKKLMNMLDSAKKDINHEASQMTLDTSDDSMQYIRDAVPGPGSYELSRNSSQFSKSSSSIQHFGTTSKRFIEPKPLVTVSETINQPISSFEFKDMHLNGQTRIKKQSSNRVFQRSNKPSSQEITEKEPKKIKKQDEDYTVKLGPGYYDDGQTMDCQTKKESKKGKSAIFADKQPRFKPETQKYEKRPDFYIDHNTLGMEKEVSKHINSTPTHATGMISKHSSPIAKLAAAEEQKLLGAREEAPKKSDFYSQQFNTIESKVRKYQDEEMDRIVPKPGFNTSSPRFEDLIIEVSNDNNAERAKAIRDMREAERNISLGSKGKSFAKAFTLDRDDRLPGPGSYSLDNEWNRRTFNVLYISPQ